MLTRVNVAATFENLFAISLNSPRVFHNVFVLPVFEESVFYLHVCLLFIFNHGIDSCAHNVVDQLKEEHLTTFTLLRKFTVTLECGSFLRREHQIESYEKYLPPNCDLTFVILRTVPFFCYCAYVLRISR